MSTFRYRAVLGTVLGLSLMASACGSSGGGSPSGGAPVAGQLTLGGPPECPTRPFCQAGLEKTYGIKFKAFKALDAGGPLSKSALKRGDVDIALIFSSDGAIKANDFVVLQDDKHLQNADNVVPVIRTQAANEEVTSTLNGISTKLKTNDLVDLNKKADIDKQDPDQLASSWLKDHGFSAGAAGGSKGPITVAGFNFSESSILANIYAKALESKGYKTSLKLNLGNREIVEPALEKGEIDLYPGYAATELEFINKGKGEATPEAKATVSKLNGYLQAKGLKALDASDAVDANAFCVTKATADKYKLTKLSDLSKST
jgi:osmoprotectant transport system substrate-binding protein